MFAKTKSAIAAMITGVLFATTSVVAVPSAEAHSSGGHWHGGGNWHGGGGHWHGGGCWNCGWGGWGWAGLGTGLFLGAALAAPYYYHPYYYHSYYRPHYYAPRYRYVRGVSYCRAHFHSYNIHTHTYVGYDGLHHHCG